MRQVPDRRTAGVSLVEVVIGVTVISVLVFAAGYSIVQMVEARERLVANTKTMYLAEEGYEMVRALRNNDWTDLESLTIGDTYYLDITTSAITISTTPEVIDGAYRRSFVVDEVSRDSDDDIVPNGTTGSSVDPEAREVTVIVGGPAGTSTLTGVLGNLYSI